MPESHFEFAECQATNRPPKYGAVGIGYTWRLKDKSYEKSINSGRQKLLDICKTEVTCKSVS